jgi:MSHA biogenesis protein MshP
MHPKQRIAGIGLMVTIFFLTVLSAAGLYLANQVNNAQQGSNYDLNVTRAYYAAFSGLEWGIYSTSHALPCGSVASPSALNTFSAYGLNVTVSCTTNSYTEGTDTINLTTIVSLAQFGVFPSLDYVQRQMTVTMQH